MKGIYVHIPFCIKKCNYCDFASYPSEIGRQYEYIDAVLREMQSYRGTKADTVYIGGGTPTCLDEYCLEKLLFGINDVFAVEVGAEFTVEANPKTVDCKKARILKRYGVNRISLGAQSFDDKELVWLGRLHSSDDIVRTYELLREEGFLNINLDIMYALYGQNIKNLSTSVKKVLKLNPEHISCYGLKYEPGTPFHKKLCNGEIKETDEDAFADMYDYICENLKEGGYCHYEISNFAKDKMECRHNLKYWNCEEYLGFGAAAASFEGLRRFTHSASLKDYFSGYRLCEDYTMTKDEAMREFIVLGLRLIKTGVDKRKFFEKFSLNIDDVFKEQIKKYRHFLINTENSLRLKEEACLVSNSIMCGFM